MDENKSPLEREQNPKVLHEEQDANPIAVTKFGLGLAGFLIILGFVLWFLFDYFAQREAAKSPKLTAVEKQAPKEPPAPRLQPSPPRDLREMRAAEESVLNSYGWVDASQGIVRVPIERAKEILLKQGLPVRPPGRTGKPSLEIPPSESAGPGSKPENLLP